MTTKLNLLNMLVLESGLPLDDVFRIIDTAPLRYKSYPIPKRSGGIRQIAQPARELKALQYVLLDHVLNAFPVHPSAAAYEKGRGIKDNAAFHASSNCILKLDFKSFFPSIGPRDWSIFAKKNSLFEFSDIDVKTISRLLFWGDGHNNPKKLSIGAPTSPKVSNILLYEVDSEISLSCTVAGLKYTRYADDITISGKFSSDILNFERKIREIIRDTKSPKLTFNDNKRGLYTKGERRMVTGLVITPEGRVSLGRDRKRLINSLVDHVKKQTATVRQIATAKGYLAFAISAEPDFVNRLEKKYGPDTVRFILSYDIPSRDELI